MTTPFPTHMETLAILALLDAKPGKEAEVESFLRSALPMARAEAGTVGWYAVKLAPSRFAIFDTFHDEGGRDAHLSGPIAAALMASAAELLAAPPRIERAEVLAAKPASS